MSKLVKAHITPEVLKWAREQRVKVTVRYAAKKLRVKPAQIEAWESGEDQPTFDQLKQIAALYKTHLTIFYLPEPPRFDPIVPLHKGFNWNE